MLRIHGFAAALLLTGCSAEQSPSQSPQPTASSVAEPSPTPSVTPVAARKVEESGDAIDFGYAWPAEAEALPMLRDRLESQLAKDRAEATRMAADDRRGRQADDIPFHSHNFEKNWAITGESEGLLAMVAETYTFTGGAHGNTGYDALLWDKKADREVARDAIFPGAFLTGLTERYCDALDRAREEKRGEPVPEDRDGMFNECPPLANQALAPIDRDDDGRFEAIAILLAPYEAGPYAEGSYELQLPVDAATLAAIPEPYRDAFEASR